MRYPATPKRRPTRSVRLAVLLAALCVPCALSAVQPVRHFHDLVAGEGLAGFRDGTFAQARFNHPVGIAQSEDGTRLFVTDRDNHRIRVIHLDRSNTVETLCGTATAGYRDGPLARAAFHAPTQLVSLPGGRLLVVDAGNTVFRLIDLKRNTVSTLQADPGTGAPARPLSAAGVWGVAYDAKTQMLYYSAPAAGKVRRYDFATRRVVDAVWGSAGPAQPAALALWEGALIISDRVAPEIYRLLSPAPPTTPGTPVELTPFSTQGPVAAFANGHESLVALRATEPRWVRILPQAPPISMLTTDGPLLSALPPDLGDLLRINSEVPVGFIQDRRDERLYFFASDPAHSVLALRDTGHDGTERGHFEFDYPPRKPANVYRILLLGDSRTYLLPPPFEPSPMSVLARQLDLHLATRSGLQGNNRAFQVLGITRNFWNAIALWPYYAAPRMVQQYDVDLIALVVFPSFTLTNYFQRPITPEGIPAAEDDPEFLLQDAEARIAPGIYRRLYDVCLRKKCVWRSVDGQLTFSHSDDLVADPAVRDVLVELFALPLRLLDKKLIELNKTRPRPTRMIVYFSPPLIPIAISATERNRDIWVRALKGTQIEFVDLTDPIRALVPTYFPLSDPTQNFHMFPAGFRLLTEVIARDVLTKRNPPRPAHGGAGLSASTRRR